MNGPAWERDELARRFRLFAERECRDVSPLYETLAAAIADDPAVLELASKARQGQPPPNMLLAAVQALLLSDHRDDPLARHYPSVSPEAAAASEAYPLFRAFCLNHRAAIESILARRVVSTNEPARAACLLPAFTRAADLLGEPLSLIEIGASAGLLLLCDRCAYDYGADRRAGPPESALTLTCEVRGPIPTDFPPAQLPQITARIGLDLFPLNPRDAEDRDWLRALIWPEEQARRERLEKALALAAQVAPTVIAADGIAALPDYADELGGDGPLCVLHAFTLNQVSQAARAHLEDKLQAIARARPLARIGFEWEPEHPAPIVSLTTYRAGSRERREIALADAHGGWIRFL